MEKSKVFCEECRKDVDYKIKEKQMEGTLRGETYYYTGKAAYCAECGSEIYVAEVNDFNLKGLYDAFREKNGIISLEEIQAITEKYAIGKRPLSLLLGWGEQTFSRYCDGDMPTKQYSEILKKIYADPYYYLDILEKNKVHLKTSAAYEKSKRAVNKIIGTIQNSKSKINLVIDYLLYRCEDITPLALQKALYYIQGFYYAFYNKFLFSEECEAWVHGPVYRDIYIRYRDYRFDPISGNNEFDDSVFTSAEKAVLDSVIKNVCCYSGKILEEFTHNEEPWLSARHELPMTAISDRRIAKSLIGDYFSAVKEKYNMITPDDIEDYTKKRFEQI